MTAAEAVPRLCRQTFGLAGRVLAIDVEDDAAAHLLQTAYAPAFEPAARSAHHTACMRRLGDGRLHVRFDRRTIPGPAGSAAALLTAHYAAKEIFARFAAALPGQLAFYGALVAVQGAAVLILGPATIGKSVFALHLAANGARFLGDETAVLDLKTRNICALARKPALRESALPVLPDGLAERVEAAAHVLVTDRGRFWYALDGHNLSGMEPSDQRYPLRGICIIKERAQQMRLARVDAARALPAILQRAYSRPSQLAALSALGRAVRHVPIYEMALAEPAICAAALLEEVRE